MGSGYDVSLVNKLLEELAANVDARKAWAKACHGIASDNSEGAALTDDAMAFFEEEASLLQGRRDQIAAKLHEQRNMGLVAVGPDDKVVCGVTAVLGAIVVERRQELQIETFRPLRDGEPEEGPGRHPRLRTEGRLLQMEELAMAANKPVHAPLWREDLTAFEDQRRALMEEKALLLKSVEERGFHGDFALARQDHLAPSFRPQRARLSEIGHAFGGIRDRIAAYIEAMPAPPVPDTMLVVDGIHAQNVVVLER